MPLSKQRSLPTNLPVQRAAEFSVSTLATIYGCCGLFDLCTDNDLMSLSFERASPFLDWIGWTATDVCEVRRAFINWVRPTYSGATPTPGWLSDACANPNTVAFGVCEFLLENFARLRRGAPIRDVTKMGMRLCEAQPRYRLDGSLVADEREFNEILVTEVLLQDLKKMIITGNATTAGQFDGLQRLVKTGYTDFRGRRCESMDAMVLNWNNNTMAGGAGITWNGVAVGATYNLVDVLRQVVRQGRRRIKLAPTLAAQTLRVGDIIIVLPELLGQCLLDQYTCWSVCDGGQYNEANINTLEARGFRDGLNGGLFGDGRIFIDGLEIPLVYYDWELLNDGGTGGDMYLLTGRVGNMKTLMGEYFNMNSVPAGYPELDYFATDGGRILGWFERDHTCIQQIHEMQPRIVSWAPFLNARFQNVGCTQPGGPISADPTFSFFIESSFPTAYCP